MLKELENRPTSTIICGQNKEHAKFMEYLANDCLTKRKKQYEKFLEKYDMTKSTYYGWNITNSVNTFILFARNYWNWRYKQL